MLLPLSFSTLLRVLRAPRSVPSPRPVVQKQKATLWIMDRSPGAAKNENHLIDAQQELIVRPSN